MTQDRNENWIGKVIIAAHDWPSIHSTDRWAAKKKKNNSNHESRGRCRPEYICVRGVCIQFKNEYKIESNKFVIVSSSAGQSTNGQQYDTKQRISFQSFITTCRDVVNSTKPHTHIDIDTQPRIAFINYAVKVRLVFPPFLLGFVIHFCSVYRQTFTRSHKWSIPLARHSTFAITSIKWKWTRGRQSGRA